MRPVPPAVVEIVVADPPEAWRAAGFAVCGEVAHIGSVEVRLLGRGCGEGVVGWTISGEPGGHDEEDCVTDTEIDSLPTRLIRSRSREGGPLGTATAAHPNGALLIDHVVVLTSDVARATAAFEARGFEVRRVRDVARDRPVRQVFFRGGEVVIELVGPPEPASGDAAATTRFFGLAITVADLDATARLLGGRLGRIKDAVQEERRIATLRHADVGISTAIAFMSPAT